MQVRGVTGAVFQGQSSHNRAQESHHTMHQPWVSLGGDKWGLQGENLLELAIRCSIKCIKWISCRIMQIFASLPSSLVLTLHMAARSSCPRVKWVCMWASVATNLWSANGARRMSEMELWVHIAVLYSLHVSSIVTCGFITSGTPQEWLSIGSWIL